MNSSIRIAVVVKLVDTLASGASPLAWVGVRVPLRAPWKTECRSVYRQVDSSKGTTLEELCSGHHFLLQSVIQLLLFSIVLIIGTFSQKVLTIRYLIEKLQLKNKNLRKTRDLLLPKLMSGEMKI